MSSEPGVGAAARAYLVLAGTATGLMMGIKATGPIYAVILGGVLVIALVWSARQRRTTRRVAVGATAAFTALVILFGS